MPYWRLNYHLVWSTKNREPALLGEIVSDLQRAIWTTAKTMTLQVHALNVQPDHVHFAFSAPPKYPISEVARQLKGSSSHFLGEHHEGFWPGWQTEYGVVSFGGQSLPRIVQYVNHQDDHHREARLWLELEKGTELIVPRQSTSPTTSPEETFDV